MVGLLEYFDHTGWFVMPEFLPVTPNGDCEEIANKSTAYGRRRRNWLEAHGLVPAGQVVDARCGNEHCIAPRHCYLRPRIEPPRTYVKSPSEFVD
jgi:hypothetical protein